MHPAMKATLEKKALKVIEALGKRGMKGYWFPDVEAAAEQLLSLIPEGSVVGMGGSVTLPGSGVLEKLRAGGGKYTLLDRYKDGVTKAEEWDYRVRGLASDVYLTSTNALTEDGILVNVDGLGNRVAAMTFGPRKVIFIAGVNKIVPTLEDALRRIKHVVAPANAVRFGAPTICAKTGFHSDKCRPPMRICNKTLIIEGEGQVGRSHVILVGEELGF